MCTNPTCSRRFARRAEMLQHVWRDHGARASPQGEEEGATLACTVAGCYKTYKVQGWLTKHLQSCHPNVTPTTTTGRVKAGGAGKPSSSQMRGQSTGKFACNFPGCTKTLGSEKGIRNHGYVKHNWSIPRSAPLGEGLVELIAEDREATPCLIVALWYNCLAPSTVG